MEVPLYSELQQVDVTISQILLIEGQRVQVLIQTDLEAKSSLILVYTLL